MTKNLWYFRAPVIRILYIEGEQYMTDNQTSDLPDDSIIVIFGASGDLTARKLIPAYYDLFVHHRMPRTFAILGVGRTEYRDESFRTRHEQALRDIHGESRAEIDRIRSFLDRIRYHSMQTDAAEAYSGLARRLASLRADLGIDENYLYYLATPPNLYPLIPVLLSDAGLADTARGWKRIIVEKPFGYDGQSARDLDDTLHRHFDESQIFRIDHYLGKETVQNLLVFRFANGMFEPLWNRNHIDYVEITAAESIGVENRGGYYDATGALRDMFQNHLLQVLAIAAMEPPAVISARATRDEILKVLQCLRPLTEADLRDHLVLGQYTASKIGGQPVPGYRGEDRVAEDSRTETYVSLKLFVDNWRWNGVPFYVRTGKRLPTRVTEVVIHFTSTPHPAFSKNGIANKLIIRIQPDEGILVKFGLKKPGAGFDAQEVAMDFHYQDLEGGKVFSAYERLLLDAAMGDATLFARSDAVRACWEFVEPILRYRSSAECQLYGYAAGTWGPKEADELLAADGRQWRFPCKNLADASYCEL
jgi:glucose-6-phosphate 1-dehydrogenase